MPSLINAVPKYRKHKGSGQAVVVIAGHDHYLGPHATKASRLEYDRLITEWITAGRGGRVAASRNCSRCQRLSSDWHRCYSIRIMAPNRSRHSSFGNDSARRIGCRRHSLGIHEACWICRGRRFALGDVCSSLAVDQSLNTWRISWR
jgi:hypothetical protein